MITIRPFEADDLTALYGISLMNALAGADASHLYRDPKMMGHIYSAPYAVLEPGLALVVEDGEGVAGFAVGTADTGLWEARLERAWWPLLRSRYADPSTVPSEARTLDQQRAYMIHRPVLTPLAVTGDYPAHLHLNLAPRRHGRGLSAKLFEAWLALAMRHRIERMHVGVRRDNERGIRFWARQAFVPITPDDGLCGRTLWMGRG